MAEQAAGRSLGSYSPVDYMSITSFPRLPEEEAGGEPGPRVGEEDTFLGEHDSDPDAFLKSARLQRLPSSSSEMGSQDASPLRETAKDPFTSDCSCRQDGLTVIITACVTFAIGVTIALIMQIYFGDPQIFHQGAVVSDASRCTNLGIEVLEKRGSSVDAAIVTTLCLGIVNPHTSGLGGGGVMLIHDIRNNVTDVIDFRETAPSGIHEDLVRRYWKEKPGILVGIPGMLKGLAKAHEMYGKLPWEELITKVAEVARDGFNVTYDLANAINDVKGQNLSRNFRETFLPDGQPLQAGTFTSRLDLAAILDDIAAKGSEAFYAGNWTQEMVSEVNMYGGVLDDEDFSNYSVSLQKPVQTIYQGHLVFAPPAPHAGPALITALNILDGANLTKHTPRPSALHWIAETLKIALATASTLGDPVYDPSLVGFIKELLSKSETSFLRQQINDSYAAPTEHYMHCYAMDPGPSASQALVIGPDDFIVAVVSSLNRPFGSGIMTPSGILLNSQILDFFWTNRSSDQSSSSPRNNVEPGKRPLSFLLPTLVRPAQGLCGTYLSLGGSNGERALSGIAQVLLNVLSFNKNLSESVSLGRLHPDLQSNLLQVDGDFPENVTEGLESRGHLMRRSPFLSLVHGSRRSNDLIIGIRDPRSKDAEAATIL
ncbi:glutathione hydrolase 7 [Pelobates cultripes]|uniref:Glutathione hydrolase n=1 Tax=Pelobates cultripes TaxID=61616 RepID=A0AAD1S724_PELCU|nr:glutathione hydrolase 7 [Pelobates cultripes]